MSTDTPSDLDDRIAEAIADAIEDAAAYAPVRARLTANEYENRSAGWEARSADEAYAGELVDRITLIGQRIPVDFDVFWMLLEAELRREPNRRRRRTAPLPSPIADALDAARIERAAADREFQAAHARRARAREVEHVADAVARAWTREQREAA